MEKDKRFEVWLAEFKSLYPSIIVSYEMEKIMENAFWCGVLSESELSLERLKGIEDVIVK